MRREHIGYITSRTQGVLDIYRGYDTALVARLYEGAFHPGIVATLGGKDQRRFHPDKFGKWAAGDGDPRTLYTAYAAGRLAGTFWVGGKDFPTHEFPEAGDQKAEYTVAFRTAYETDTPGRTFAGEGVGKRLAVAGLADYAELTRNGGPNGRPPLAEVGAWLDTGVDNLDGQNLYHHVGNVSRDEPPRGFVDVGVYHAPEAQPGETQEESRVGMVITPATLQEIIAVSYNMPGLTRLT